MSSILPRATDSKSEPSDTDRRTATLLMTRFYPTDGLQIVAVAQAFADQRAAYEALADELEREDPQVSTRHIAARIRGLAR